MSRRAATAARRADRTLLIGALILAAAAVVVYVSYTAPTGLPWQAKNQIRIAVPDAGKLVRNAEVRIGGARVGQILSIQATPRRENVPAHALLDVQLDGHVAALPTDTQAEVRLASVLGGKYLELVPGRSRETIPWHGLLPLENSSATIDIEDAFDVFRPEGREAMRAAIGGLADAMAGRGTDMNATLAASARLLPGLERVLRTLSAADTDLPGFLKGTAATATTLRSVAGDLGPFVTVTARTFGALDAAGDALGQSIAELPATARDTRSALAAMGPALVDLAAISRDLEPAAAVLPSALHRAGATVRTAIRVDPLLASVARPLDRTLGAVERFASNPASTTALKLLGDNDLATFGTSAFLGLGAVLRTTWEGEEHCRIASNWMQRLSAVASDGDEGGNWMRMLPVLETNQSMPQEEPSANQHANPYPREDATECEAGNEPFTGGVKIGNPPGRQGVPGAGR